jgi:hypothetical protein
VAELSERAVIFEIHSGNIREITSVKIIREVLFRSLINKAKLKVIIQPGNIPEIKTSGKVRCSFWKDREGKSAVT